MARLALMIDLERCTGCKSCEAACKQTNALGPLAYRNRVMWFGEQESQGDSDALPRLDFLTVTCQQCERPACLRACPVHPKAISKDPHTGVVSINENRCTGCGECALSCPYGAIGYDADQHHAVKCDLCADRRANNQGPACAQVCPTRAISYGERDKLLQQASADARELLDTDHFLQNPATVYLRRLRDKDQPDSSGPGRLTPSLMLDNEVRGILRPEVALGSYNKLEKASEAELPERIEAGGCNICFNACPIKYHLRGNRVVNIYGNTEDPVFQGRICPKSQMTLQMYNNPHRLVQPLKRVGKRGSDKFEPISWQQAIDEIAQKLSTIRAQYGSESLAIHAGTRTGVLNIIGAVPLFAGLWGTPNVASTEPFCSLAKGLALELVQGMGHIANVYTEDDIGSASLYVYVGDNQAETRPVNFGLLNDWRMRNKAKMIVVDPRLTVTASKADEWLAIRSGTDMALGLGIIHYLFEHNLADLDFCEQWVEGWQVWREFVREKKYTVEWAAVATDLQTQKIVALAQAIASADGCMIFLSRGINQHTNALQTNRVFMFLAAITGNWGRKSGGFFNFSSELDWRPPAIPDNRKPATKAAIGRNPLDWLEAMITGEPYPVRALITGNNPLGQWPNQSKLRTAFESLDLIVHMELFKNETSRYADYVLPMASGIEKGGTTRFAEDRRIVWNDRFIDPPGEAKSDHWFWIELGKRFGFDDVLKPEYSNPRTLWDEVLVAATPDIAGVTIERLTAMPNRTIRIPLRENPADELDPLYITQRVRSNPDSGEAYPTPGGKLEFWTEGLEQKFAELGFSALPEFYSEKHQLVDLPYLQTSEQTKLSPFFDNDVLVHPAIIKYPQTSETENPAPESVFDTELVSGRPPAPHFHSWTHYFWQAQEMWPELYCQIHPDKASKNDIKDGDRIVIETSNGTIKARAWLYRGIRPSTVFIPIGWDEAQPYHPASSVNHLTGTALDPISQQANLKTHLCRVSRA